MRNAGTGYDEGPRMRNRAFVAAIVFLTLVPIGSTFGQEEASELLSRALSLSPASTVSVEDVHGDALHLVDDWNRDGRSDVAVLSVEADAKEVAFIGVLSDRERLFDDNAEAVAVFLELLLEGADDTTVIPLGNHAVVSDFAVIALGNGVTAVGIAFRSSLGTSHEIVSVSRSGEVSRVSYRRTASEYGFLTDVDGDGATELIRTLKLPEAGRGFETFVERLVYENGTFIAHGSVPLVRTILDFLAEFAEELTSKSPTIDSVLTHIADPTRVASLQDVFRPLSGVDDGAFDYLETETPIESVIFPAIRDNPLPLPFLGRSFPILMRVDCCVGTSRYFQARVQFPLNPFDGGRPAFLTEEESEQ